MTIPQPIFLLPNQIVIHKEEMERLLSNAFDEGYDIGKKHGRDGQIRLQNIRFMLNKLLGEQKPIIGRPTP